jgi:DNA polymerase III subunit epsilon
MDGLSLALLLVVAVAAGVIFLLLPRAPRASTDPVADAINRRLQEIPRQAERSDPPSAQSTAESKFPADLPAPAVAATPPKGFAPEIVAAMPKQVMFLDVETTGLHSTDRVVCLGALTLETAKLQTFPFDVAMLHLVFDPMKKSHREAERVHGWDDWTLRHQDLFADHAEAIRAAIDAADLVVAHNASFDIGFIDRELTMAGLTMPTKPVECTMRAWRARGLPRATLSAVCGHLGLGRAGDVHGALEDAGLAMQAWLALHSSAVRLGQIAYPPPSNLKPAPPRPDGSLPRRRSRKPSSADQD